MSSLKLYNYFRSSTSYRVRIALEIKQLDYTYVPVHLINNGGEQNSENYRNLNAIGGIPTLVHNGQIISQSLAIIEYLDEAYPNTPKLFPEDPFLKAKVRQVCEIINSDIHPLQNLKVTQFLEKNLALSTEQKQAWLNKWIIDGLIAIEKTLTPFTAQYSFGDSLTAADTMLIPQLFSAQRLNVDTKKFNLLTKVNENCLKLMAFHKAHPYKQPDTPEDLRLK